MPGTENGLGETGIEEWDEPNFVLPVGTGSGVTGDGGSFGLEPGEGHNVAGGAEEVEPANPLPQSGSADSSCGSMTVGSDEGGNCKFCLHSWMVSLISVSSSHLLSSCRPAVSLCERDLRSGGGEIVCLQSPRGLWGRGEYYLVFI